MKRRLLHRPGEVFARLWPWYRCFIPLELLKIYEGEERIALAVLKPKEELRESVSYVFAADGIPEQALVTCYNSKPLRSALWATAEADHDPPVWSSPPRVLDSTYKRKGCGPASFARVAIDAKDAGPLFVKVEFERASHPRRVSYLLPLAGNETPAPGGPVQIAGPSPELTPKKAP